MRGVFESAAVYEPDRTGHGAGAVPPHFRQVVELREVASSVVVRCRIGDVVATAFFSGGGTTRVGVDRVRVDEHVEAMNPDIAL